MGWDRSSNRKCVLLRSPVFFISLSLHSNVENSLRIGTSDRKSFELRIQNEKDPEKLRHQVIGLFDSVMEGEKNDELMLRLTAEMAAFFVFILLINNAVLGIQMHRFWKQLTSQTAS